MGDALKSFKAFNRFVPFEPFLNPRCSSGSKRSNGSRLGKLRTRSANRISSMSCDDAFVDINFSHD